MKKLIILTLILSTNLLHAEDHPCKAIKEKCEAAGFAKGKHKEHKGLAMDCMKPLFEGKSVDGVSVSSDEITACKEKREKHKARKAKKDLTHKNDKQ